MLRQAREKAGRLGISLAEYVRRLIARDLEGSPKRVDPSVIFDLGRSWGSNIAENKDAMVAESFEAEQRRKKDK